MKKTIQLKATLKSVKYDGMKIYSKKNGAQW